jgi:hypothetical protein
MLQKTRLKRHSTAGYGGEGPTRYGVVTTEDIHISMGWRGERNEREVQGLLTCRTHKGYRPPEPKRCRVRWADGTTSDHWRTDLVYLKE